VAKKTADPHGPTRAIVTGEALPAGEAGFTLIELLIVVAIISILATMALPNFLDAQTRAKVGRVKNDLRALNTAVEAYVVDHNEPPFRRSMLPGNLEVPEAATRPGQMAPLTTPVAYISTLPADVFESTLTPPNNLLDYWDPVQTSWLINRRFPVGSPRRIDPAEAPYLLVSVGPDGNLGAISVNSGWPLDPLLRGSVYQFYDPTNGTISTGNIYRAAGRNTEDAAAFLMERFRSR